MIKARALSQRDIGAVLKSEGFTKAGRITTPNSGDYDVVWVSAWGEPLMLPIAGPDHRCADFILQDRLQKVLATKP